MTTTTPTTPKPRRRWLQFSLRTLLVLMLVASLPMSWLAVELRRGRQQRAAVLAVQKMGGDVRYERDASGRLRTSVPWLMGLLGEESHANVHVVGLFNRPVTYSDLIHLRRLVGQRHFPFICGRKVLRHRSIADQLGARGPQDLMRSGSIPSEAKRFRRVFVWDSRACRFRRW